MNNNKNYNISINIIIEVKNHLCKESFNLKNHLCKESFNLKNHFCKGS